MAYPNKLNDKGDFMSSKNLRPAWITEVASRRLSIWAWILQFFVQLLFQLFLHFRKQVFFLLGLLGFNIFNFL